MFKKDIPKRLAEQGVIVTPEPIAIEMVEALPKELWSDPDLKNKKFLDIACKSGIFLTALLNKLMVAPALVNDGELKDDKIREKYILDRMLYGIAVCKLSLEFTRLNLYNKAYINGNIRLIKDTYEEYLYVFKNKDSKYIQDLVKEQLGIMKIDVIIGNPPYQQATQSIYQYFIEKSIALCDKGIICMITKNNWLSSDTLKSTRDAMINNGLAEVINYPVQNEIFSDAAVSVSIFKINKASTDKDTHYVEIREHKKVSEYKMDLHKMPMIFSNKVENTILSKVLTAVSYYNFGEHVLGPKYFGINTNGAIGFDGKGAIIDDTESKENESDLQIVYMDGSKKPYIRYLNKELLPKGHDLVNKYKVVCGRTTSSSKNVITNINIAAPQQVTTASWGVLYSCETLEEAANVVSYVKTRMVRFLVSLMCSDGVQGINGVRFQFVPMQDFSHPWADEMLYEKYNLSLEEIDYIESAINPMN